MDYYNIEVEFWKEIPEFEAYEVSNLGRVRSRFKKRGFGLWPRESSKRRSIKPFVVNGYPAFVLYKNDGSNKQFKFLAHRLVLMVFVGPCPLGMEARHLDGNSKNPRLDNLSWGTPVENAADRDRHGRQIRGAAHPSAKITESVVLEIHRLRQSGLIHREIGQRLGLTRKHVTKILNRRSWAHVEVPIS